MKPAKAHYMMRYHAPLHDFDRHLRWVQDICRDASIGEVIFITDPEEYFTGFPPLDRVRRWAKVLKGAGEALRKHGVITSINPWVTLGHSGRGCAPPKELGFTAMMTGDDGAVSLDTACPADPAWQKYIAESYAIFASANPSILWLEDDHRLHNHAAVRFGCFAKPMLDRFAKRTGRMCQREELVKAIVTGKGDARKQWLTFTGELWEENAARIRKAVHAVNPDVKLAQMTSSMTAHSAEGRRWSEYLTALCGRHQPVTRPHFGPYRESIGFDTAIGIAMFRHGLVFAGRATRCCPELDTGPHSYFSKSRRQCVLQLELGQFFGCRDVTFNYFALAGNDPRNEPWVMEQLNQARPRLDALAAMDLERRVERGVHVWTNEHAALFQKTDGRPVIMDSLCPAFDAWSRVFTRVGVASTFETQGALTAVSGDTIRAADDRELRRLLSGGLLVDGRAAMALQEMGYGQHLGVRVVRRQVSGEAFAMPIEYMLDAKFGLKGSPTTCCTQMGFNWGDCYIYVHKLRGARKVSEFRSGNRKPIAPGVTLFENSLGGRVAVYPFDFDSGIPDNHRFYNHPRKCQLQAVLRWLNHGRPILVNPDMAMITVEQSSVGEMELLAVLNLGGDLLKEFTVEMPFPPKGRVEILTADGKWKRFVPQLQGHAFKARLSAAMQPFETSFLRWRRL